MGKTWWTSCCVGGPVFPALALVFGKRDIMEYYTLYIYISWTQDKHHQSTKPGVVIPALTSLCVLGGAWRACLLVGTHQASGRNVQCQLKLAEAKLQKKNMSFPTAILGVSRVEIPNMGKTIALKFKHQQLCEVGGQPPQQAICRCHLFLILICFFWVGKGPMMKYS